MLIEVDVRGPDLGIVTQNIAPLEMMCFEGWMERSGWTVSVPLYNLLPDGSAELSAGARALYQPGSGIIVRDTETGRVLYSGSTSLTSGGTMSVAERKTGVDNGVPVEMLEFSGESDLTRLGDRRIVPPSGFTHDVREGPASTVILGYLTAHFGLGADVERQDLLLRLPIDPQVGDTIETEARFLNMLEHLRTICEMGGVTVDAIQSDRERFIDVIIREPRDRTDDVVFSFSQGALAEATISAAVTEGTVVYVLGRGEGVDRMVQVVSPEQPGVRRIEQVSDSSNSAGTRIGLTLEGRAWLREHAGGVSLNVKPDLSDESPQYRKDFAVGDLVGIEIEDPITGEPVRRPERVVSAEIKATPDEVELDLVVGAVESYGEARSVLDISSLKSAVSRIETST